MAALKPFEIPGTLARQLLLPGHFLLVLPTCFPLPILGSIKRQEMPVFKA
jgi:hypothetical protein